MSKTYSQRPSELVDLRAWVQSEYGFTGLVEALEFDSAVLAVGIFIENKLNEYDEVTGPNNVKTLKPRFQSVDEVLADPLRGAMPDLRAVRQKDAAAGVLVKVPNVR